MNPVTANGPSMPVRDPAGGSRVLLAIAFPLVALVLQGVFWDALQPYVWFLFYPAVFFSSWVGGLRGGLAATALSSGLVWYCFIPPRFSFALERPLSLLSIAMFAGMGVLFSLVHERLHAANRQVAGSLARVESVKDEIEGRYRDRTRELEATNAALRESEREFRMLSEAMPQMVWMCRPDGWNIYSNQRWIDYTGLSLEESCGAGWSVPFHPDDRARAEQAWQRATATGGSYELEVRLRRADGVYRWWLVRGVPLRDERGTVLKWFGTCTDIEEIKRTAEDLAASTAKLRGALASMSDAVFISDETGRFVDFNEAFATVHRFSNREELRKRFQDYPEILEVTEPDGRVVPPEQWPVARALRGESDTHHVYGLRRLDTGETWVGAYSFAPLRGPSGAIVGSVVVGRDITEQRRAEVSLRESEARLRLAVQSANIGLWDWDLATQSVYFSPEWKSQLGFAEHEISNQFSEWQERVHPDDLATALDRVQRFLAAPQGRLENEIRLRHRDGTYRWIYSVADLLRDAAGKPARMLGCHLDITARKRSEDALRRQAERLQTLHTVDQSILRAIDSPGDIAREALDHLRRLLGCQYASVGVTDADSTRLQLLAARPDRSPEGWSGWVPEDTETGTATDRGGGRAGNLRQVADTARESWSPDEARNLAAGGVRAFIRAPLISERGRMGVLCVCWDAPRAISAEDTEIVAEMANQMAIAVEKSRLLAEIRTHAADLERRVAERTAQLESLNRELEAFSYSVSHDLRAPLRHIHGYADLLGREAGSGLSEKGRRFLKTIADASVEMGNLIDDLLAFSRMTRAAMDHTAVDLDGLVEDVRRDLVANHPERRILWETAPLPRVRGDRAMLRQVFANLLGNAVKFSRGRDPARIEVGVAGEDDGHPVLFVRDNGAGFDPQYAHKLFGVFQRLHRADEFEGTGIGLALVRRIIDRHGGRVWAEAALDQGATFSFTLGHPVADPGSPPGAFGPTRDSLSTAST